MAKRQKRLSGVDEMVISLAAKGLTTGEISAHLAEVYGAEVSRQTISTITDKVVEGMVEWQNRPLDPVYPVIFIDAIHVKIRRRPRTLDDAVETRVERVRERLRRSSGRRTQVVSVNPSYTARLTDPGGLEQVEGVGCQFFFSSSASITMMPLGPRTYVSL